MQISMALNALKQKAETIMVPGTGLIAGTTTTNKYFILEDKTHMPVIKISHSINKSNKVFHRQIKIAFNNTYQKGLDTRELQRIKLALHRAIDASHDKKELVKIFPLFKHPQLVKYKKSIIHTATTIKSKNVMAKNITVRGRY